jgi:hypothetical protein
MVIPRTRYVLDLRRVPAFCFVSAKAYKQDLDSMSMNEQDPPAHKYQKEADGAYSWRKDYLKVGLSESECVGERLLC